MKVKLYNYLLFLQLGGNYENKNNNGFGCVNRVRMAM